MTECRFTSPAVSEIPKDFHWISAETSGSHRYRCSFHAKEQLSGSFHLAALPAWHLFVDGKRTASFRTRGTRCKVFYNSFSLTLEPGDHTLEVMVPDYGKFAPQNDMSFRPGLLVSADEELAPLIGTGKAPWQVTDAPELSYREKQSVKGYCAVAGVAVSDPSLIKEEWKDPVLQEELLDLEAWRHADGFSRYLVPDPLPEFNHSNIPNWKCVRTDDKEFTESWGEDAFSGDLIPSPDGLVIPPNSRRRYLLDLGNYYCGHEEFVISGGKGAVLEFGWSESLFEHAENPVIKGKRSSVSGCSSFPLLDRFIADGKENTFFNPDYRSGRFVEIRITAGDEPLTLKSLCFSEDRYPLDPQVRLFFPDNTWEKAVRSCIRTLQMCAHDTFMDCPHYEQMMYLGDLRLQLLTWYSITRDRVLPNHVLELLADHVSMEGGVTCSRFPARQNQAIPGFSLIFAAIVSDYIRYTAPSALTRKLIAAAARVLMEMEQFADESGLLKTDFRWNFMDWVPSWKSGVPPAGDRICGPLNALYLYCLNTFADICGENGEPELEVRFKRIGSTVYENMLSAFFSEEESLFSDNPEKTNFSEHTNALMLLSGFVGDATSKKIANALFEPAAVLSECTLYFDFYYFAAAAKYRRMDKFFERAGQWKQMTELDASTCFERMDNFIQGCSRSDCHAWSAMLVYHFFASVAGIRPSESGGTKFTFDPMPGPFMGISGILPVEKGEIFFNITPEKTELYATEGIYVKRKQKETIG